MTTTPAMPELNRGQIIDLISPSSKNSADHDIEFAYRVRAALSSQPSPEQAAVSDEEIRCLGQRNAWHYKYSSDPAHSSTYKFNDACLLQFARAILALRPAQQSESKTYSDGTTATGPAPLPEVSPAEQDANLAESLLIDLESMLGQRSGASIKLRSLIRSMRPAQQAVPMTEEQRQRVFAAAEHRTLAFDNVSWRDAIVDAVEAHYGIHTKGAQEWV